MTNKIEKLIDLPSCCKQREQCPGNCNKCIAEHLIKNGAILQKHGRWIILPYTEQYNYKCSNCEKGSDLMTDYCPHCGAKMDLDKE